MNYSEMTDFEINLAVAKLLPSLVTFDDNKNPITLETNCAPAYTGSDYDQIPFEPCNSWADAGPIIEKHLICLAADVFAEPQDGGKWVAQPAYGWDSEGVRSDNPLRAAMIVFLMLQEAK